MSVRQPKPTRKGPNSNDSAPSRRAPAWTGARASPTFSPAPSNARLPNAPAAANPTPNAPPAFPPLPAAAPRSDSDKVLQALTGLTGTTITLNTKTSQRYEGVIASTTGEGDTTGVSLRDVKEISLPGAPLKDQIFIASTNIDTWTSGPADAKAPNGDSFKTDTDISHKPRRTGSERELQAWADSPLPPGIGMSPPLLPVPAHHTDDITFGAGASQNSQWDQFAANERLFGVKTAFDEDLYTTKLDRNAKDYKERERRAQVLAAEIMGTTVNNPHIAEERVMNNLEGTGDGENEEDKYGAVVRGQNAYVPPGARKGTGKAPDIPKVAVNAPDGTAVEAAAGNGNGSSGGSKAPSPAPGGASKPPADALPAFREFVTNEKQRLAQKRSVLMKNDRDKRMAELVKFSQSFKLNKPIPDDLVTILAKDEEKQKQIRDKSSADAASAQARAIAAGAGAPTPSASSNHVTKQTPPPPAKTPPKGSLTPSASTGNALGLSGPGLGSAAKPKRISMVIQPIPPFKGRGGKPSVNVNTQVKPTPSAAVTPTTANKLNVNASSFKPNPKAVAFTPVSASPNTAVSPSVASASPKPKGGETSAATPSTPNPFFGTRLPKKQPVHIKDDFNPFKYNKVAEASAVTAMWPYQGKRYMQMFPPVSNPPQQQSPHMAPPGPPPMPPPSYEEDSAAQAAAATRGGYVYAYPPYAYPGQPMMPGMGPPPPGMYAPGPYMQPMHYPPMPPPNGQPMYASPQMGQMPPPQFMPPPPGQYPPPPSGGPRPNMPQTPLPQHAHPYYHQSPQRMPVSPSPGDKAMTTPYPYFAVQHAVPYPMMMQPPPPHGYEGPVPPVQMGGHA